MRSPAIVPAVRSILTLTAVVCLAMGGTAFAKKDAPAQATPGTKNQEGVRVDDLPKPIPGFMKSIQEIGNKVGEGISKATSEGARAVKKTLKGKEQETDKK